jgi:hypothetical protein
LEIKIKALPLHPQSGKRNGLTGCAKVLRNIFEKKVTKKFGSFKNMLYLCTRFSALKNGGSSDKKMVL